jgi:hypothetical protein
VRQVDFLLYLVCDGCRRIGTYHGLDLASAVARARAGGWVICQGSDHCSSCARAA